MTEEEVLKALGSEMRKRLPSGSTVVSEATDECLGPGANNADWIKQNFSELVEKIQIQAYKKYLAAERPAVALSFRAVFGELLPPQPSVDQVFDLLANNFWALDRFFLGLTQGRRPRAGKAFEHVIRVLFTKLDYPYTPQAIINGQPDFLLPSAAHFRRVPMDCIIFTIKRTLRERWRQIVTEGTRGYLFFLATIDEKIAARDLPEMLKSRIYVVTPERIRAKHYGHATNVISFETFFQHYLDPAMTRWKATGII